MKNKRIRLLGLLLAVLCLFCSCGRTVAEEEESSTWTPPWAEETTDLYSLSFPVECFTSLTTEELLARRKSENDTYDEMFFDHLDTPLCIYGLRHTAMGPTTKHTAFFAYDKQTGIFSDACRDPLCDHSSCVWGTIAEGLNIYCGADGLFFVDLGDEHSSIYATDFQGNDAKKIYQTVESIGTLKQVGKYLWFMQGAWYEEKGRYVDALIRLDLETGRTVIVLRNDQDDFYDFCPLGGKVLYRPDIPGITDEDPFIIERAPSYRLRDPDTGEDVLFLDGESAKCEYTVLGLHDNMLYYSSYAQEEQTYHLYRRGDGGYGEEELLTEPSKGAFGSASGTGTYYRWEWTDSGAVLYRVNEEPYTIEVGEKITALTLDGDLLLCYYNIREGFFSEYHWLMIDMKTEEQLDFLLS